MENTFLMSMLFGALQIIALYLLLKAAKHTHPIIAILLFGGKVYAYYRAIEYVIYNDLLNLDRYLFGFMVGLPLMAIIIFLYIAYVGKPLILVLKRAIVFIAPRVFRFLRGLFLLLVSAVASLFSKQRGKAGR